MQHIFYIRQEGEKLILSDETAKDMPARTIIDIAGGKRVFAFNGKMGAGKTTLIKQLCEEMGVEDIVNSPTFAIVNVYTDDNGDNIYHFDCYRLRSTEEALDLGAEEYLDSGDYCFIEWPEIISPLLDEQTVVINLTTMPDGKRKCAVCC